MDLAVSNQLAAFAGSKIAAYSSLDLINSSAV